MNPIAPTCSLLPSIGIVVLTVSPESVRQQSVPPHPAAPSRAAYRQPPMLSDGWVTASLDASVDSAQIERMTASLRSDPTWNIHAVLIERDGRLVYEEYFAGEDQRWGMPLGRLAFNREMRHDLRSVTKSVVSALIGIAIGSGRRESLDRLHSVLSTTEGSIRDASRAGSQPANTPIVARIAAAPASVPGSRGSSP
jgi:CubicO group peptidase (beta-lactamase class C family)